MGETTKPKNRAAVSLGRKGGLNSRKSLSDEEKTRLAKKAAKARWDKAREAEGAAPARKAEQKAAKNSK